MRRNSLLKLFAAAMAWLSSGLALAQKTVDAYPAKPVTIIIPFVPGASADHESRLYSQKLTESMGHAFVHDYKPGAGAIIAMTHVGKAAPDGYTLIFTSQSYSIIPAFYTTNPPYDAVRDFTPVSLMSKRPTMLLVHPSLPANSLQEYIAYARTHPGEINFATTGAGGAYHIAGAWLHSLTNTRVTFVHYKGGAPVYIDLLAGRVNATPGTFLMGLQYVKAGKLRALANLGLERSPSLPDLRTAAEQGLPEYEYPSWSGYLAPARTPAAIVNKLSAEFAKASKAPDVIQKLESQGAVPVGSTAEQFMQTIVTEVTRWRKVVQENNLKIEG